MLLIRLFLSVCCAFVANHAVAGDWAGPIEVPPLGTQVVYQVETRQGVRRQMEVYVGKVDAGLHQWDMFGFYSNGKRANKPFQKIYRDDQFRLVKLVSNIGTDNPTIREYTPFKCDRTLGACSYSWTRRSGDEVSQGSETTNSFLENGYLVVQRQFERFGHQILQSRRSKFNRYGMTTEATLVSNGHISWKLTLLEVILQ